MQISKVPEQKRSLGALRRANKTKPRSPDLTGQLKLQRHTAAAIVEQFNHDHVHEVVCNIAGWKNQDNSGSYTLSYRHASYIGRPLSGTTSSTRLSTTRRRRH